MRRLTFIGYLQSNVYELTSVKTTSIARMAELASEAFPRVAESVFLLAATQEKLPELQSAIAKMQTTQESHSAMFPDTDYDRLVRTFPTPAKLLAGLAHDDRRIPLRYRKVYRSYLSRTQRLETDRNASLLMRNRAVELMHKKGLSNYRVYTDLRLNPGNINAFLKNADPTKVSRATARRILSYVQQA
jgi:hypothetical protein